MKRLGKVLSVLGIGCGAPPVGYSIIVHQKPQVPTVQFAHLDDLLRTPFDEAVATPVQNTEGWFVLPEESVSLNAFKPEHIHVQAENAIVDRVEYLFWANGKRDKARGWYLNETSGKNDISLMEDTMTAICHALTSEAPECITPSPIREMMPSGEYAVTEIMTKCSCSGHYADQVYNLRSESSQDGYFAATSLWIMIKGK